MSTPCYLVTGTAWACALSAPAANPCTSKVGSCTYYSVRWRGTFYYLVLYVVEALLEFARRHKGQPPSWCDASKGEIQPSRSPEELEPAAGTAWYDRPRDVSEPSRAPEELKPASEAMTKEEMWSVCNEEQAAGRKEPNVKELSAAVQPRLQRKGYRASRRWIEKLAEAPEFKRRRRPPGISSHRAATSIDGAKVV